MLVDDSGQMIYHPELHTSYTTNESLSIAKLEPDITYYLKKNQHIEEISCDDFAWKARYHTLNITLPNPIDKTDSYPAIYMSPIEDTNLFLVMKTMSGAAPHRTCQACSGPSVPDRCLESMSCSCPCITQLQFKHCQNTFDIDSDVNRPCTVSLPNDDQYRTQSQNSGIINRVEKGNVKRITTKISLTNF